MSGLLGDPARRCAVCAVSARERSQQEGHAHLPLDRQQPIAAALRPSTERRSGARPAGAAGGAPGQEPAQGGPSTGSGATGSAGGNSAIQAPPGQDPGTAANTGGHARGEAAPSGTSPAGPSGTDGIADPQAGAPATGTEAAEKVGNGFLGRTAAEHVLNVAKHASRGLGHAQDALRHQGLSGGINIRLNHPE